ncbi:MAG: CDP-glycerol glycerophosphotransferase family protein [Acutalibacteraceae bacterium]|nr:CDP-glycerol glycerophosphotransferase family protein [Acutalibacteraceae bacterium]
MVKKIIKRFKSFKNNCEPAYIEYCQLPIDEKLVLLEGGQGSNINGNMFSMLKELKTNPRWEEYTCAFVVTEDTIEKARKRMAFYGFKDVILSVRNSNDYLKHLATAKYVMTDNSFPPYFNKRDEQIFFNTWHGTPLKTLGKANKSSLSSIGNVQKNYLMSDYALFPNEFTRNVFMDDYYLRNIYKGKSLIANYPRNYIFYDAEAGVEMKKKLGFEGKKIYAYMPTWRDAANDMQKAASIKETEAILREFDKKLDDSSVLLVNLHFLLSSEINCDKYKHVEYFSGDYDTYEILNACDGLITDYSSVFFDFAITGKKVILFAYDKEKYLSTRGTYMPFEDLPFAIVEKVDDVVNEMQKPYEVSQEFLDEYCPNGSIDSCEKLFEMLVNGESDVYKIETTIPENEKTCLVYAGVLPDAHFDGLKIFKEQNPDYKYIVAYRRNLSQAKKDAIEAIDPAITLYGLLNAFQFTFKEFFVFIIFRLFGKVVCGETLSNFFEREANRMFYSFEPDMVVDFSCGNVIISGLLQKLRGVKRNVKHGDFFAVADRTKKINDFVYDFEKANSFETVDLFEAENKAYVDNNETGIAHASLRKNSRMKNILPIYYNKSGCLKCISLFKLTTPKPVALKDTMIYVGENRYQPKYIASKNKAKKSHFGIYSFSIPMSDVVNLPATNMVALEYKDQYGFIVQCHIFYWSLLKFFLGLRGPMNIDEESSTVAIFRQSQKKRLNIYVRSVNVTDKFSHRVKQVVAFGLSLLWHSNKARKLVLLYEKNSSKYEESASVLFENLIDSGYKNAYFIVTKDYEFFDRIPEKYLSNIIYKYSFKHYLYFFKSKTFIGTEAIAHSIDLKTFNLLALRKIASKNLNYVFLQHGVMYMVSLNSESRKMFKRKDLNGKYRVVVSSQAESDHFTTLGRHYDEDIYITGLPKFDRNTHNENADKIVIMPTWRPWEINEARTDFTQTPYFKMLMKLYDAVPEHLKEKVIILPHPLIVNELSKLSETLTKKIVLDARYDDILKDTAVLITDYSSIAYDAFYRGARVIFYWEEKDYCMMQYGPSTVLMLNEENVYGDFAYNDENLAEIIEKNYNTLQTEEQKNRYTKLVNFHDGKNTERLINFLKEDGII